MPAPAGSPAANAQAAPPAGTAARATAAAASTRAAVHITTAATGTTAALRHRVARAAGRAEAEGGSDPHIQGNEAGAGQVVARHQVRGDPGDGSGAEAANRSLIQRGARRRGEGRPGVGQGVAVKVAAELNVVRSAGLNGHKRTHADVEWRED